MLRVSTHSNPNRSVILREDSERLFVGIAPVGSAPLTSQVPTGNPAGQQVPMGASGAA